MDDPFPAFRVEVARWFITENDPGLIDQRPGNGHPLLFASRQLIRLMMDSLFQSNFIKNIQSLSFKLLLGAFPHLDHRRQQNILQSRKLRKQMIELKDKADFAIAYLCPCRILQVVYVSPFKMDRTLIGPV